jgi:glutamate carboxypeptidase
MPLNFMDCPHKETQKLNPQNTIGESVNDCISDVSAKLDDYTGLIAELVNLDSGADSPDGILAVEQKLAEQLANVEARITWQKTGDTVSHFKATIPGGADRIVLLGHADTVFGQGTAAKRPFSIADNQAFGPGVVDMKGGLVLALAALNWLIENKLPRPTIEFLVVGDEETRTSPPPFIEDLKTASACLVLECGRPGGGFVVSRKGGAWATVSAVGFPSHAGTEPEKGKNAILALCREIRKIGGLDRLSDELTLVVGMISGGTAVNVVPERAEARIDIRSAHEDALTETLNRIAEFGSHEGISMALNADLRWPAMARGNNETLIALYETVAGDAGATVFPVSTGGMSDGNWFANVGVPTLDGLGPVGGLDHGPDEYMEISSLATRAGLLAGTIVALAGS